MTLRRQVRAVQTFLRQRAELLDFRNIPDPRDPRGCRWSKTALLSTALFALAVITRSLRGAERLSTELTATQRRLGIRRRVPDSTLGDFLAGLDPEPLRRHLHRQVLAEHRRKALEPSVLPLRAISIDGKTVATLDAELNQDCQKQKPRGRPAYWLYRVVRAALISSQAPLCIDQQAIPARTNDCGVFANFFTALMRTYRRADLFEVVSVDAGFTSEENARLVDAFGKAYVCAIKGNQPDLEKEAWRVLGHRARTTAPEAQTDWELDSSRGWVKRQLWRTTDLAAWGTWTHLRQVWLVRVLHRRSKNSPEQVLEDRLFATNLPRPRLAPVPTLDLVRAHWRIENCCFGTLDVQWHEDVLAYNLLCLLRAVHLRSKTARLTAWQQLRDRVRDALVWPSLLRPGTTLARPPPAADS